jgi:hypothetical protein
VTWLRPLEQRKITRAIVVDADEPAAPEELEGEPRWSVPPPLPQGSTRGES